jgi:hypothetical protein
MATPEVDAMRFSSQRKVREVLKCIENHPSGAQARDDFAGIFGTPENGE